VTQVLALGCLILVVYAYGLFPLWVYIRAWLSRKPWRTAEITPTVSIIIICHNEAAHIEKKLRNVLSLDYPSEALEVIVASDGSDDGTDDIVRLFWDQRVTLLSYSRRGKIPALNDAVPMASGEILVFSDANSQFASDALRKLTRHFADPSIGCVAGNQVYTDDPNAGAAASGERSYWSFDRSLKFAESIAGNTISATGAIYAIRSALFQEVPSGVTDDFTISTRVIRQGYRIVFDPDAIASEPVAGKPRAEFRRKVRVMTRGLRAVLTVRDLLNPLRYGFYSLQLFSHKVLRRLVVLPLLVLLGLSPWLWNVGWFFQALLMTQMAVYLPSLAGCALARTRLGRCRALSVPYYFCLVNVAALMAVLNVLCGRKIERWDSQRAELSSDQIQPTLVGNPSS
jgi:cellulose synthase/poly-beta-1,6-N-acetylglucosamine synthase-like glycosyltransferase